MITFGYLQELFTDATGDTTDMSKVKRTIMSSYYDVCSKKQWKFLEKTISLDVTDLADGAPIPLPGDFNKPVGPIIDGTHDYYQSHSRDRLVSTKRDYNWYFADVVQYADILASGSTLTVSENGTSLTSTDQFPATDCSGEYIAIENNMGRYRIDTWTSIAAMTIEEPYKGAAVQNGYFEVRPQGTKTINFCTSNGTYIAPSAPVLTYTRHPLPLYNERDPILLPGDAAMLMTHALRTRASQMGWTRAHRLLGDDFITAFADAQFMEPTNRSLLGPSLKTKGHLGHRPVRWGK